MTMEPLLPDVVGPDPIEGQKKPGEADYDQEESERLFDAIKSDAVTRKNRLTSAIRALEGGRE